MLGLVQHIRKRGTNLGFHPELLELSEAQPVTDPSLTKTPLTQRLLFLFLKPKNPKNKEKKIYLTLLSLYGCKGAKKVRRRTKGGVAKL
jgi:hypothetical protein